MFLESEIRGPRSGNYENYAVVFREIVSMYY
jgi:hypothetical protein